MIEKMTFLSITGLKDDLDRVIEEHISKFDIQLENTLVELKTIKGLLPYVENNPYKDSFALANELNKSMNITDTELKGCSLDTISVEEASRLVQKLNTEASELLQKKENIDSKQNEYESRLDDVKKFIGLNYDISKILHFEHIRFRFGRIQKDYYDKFMNFVYDDTDSIFYKCQEEDDYVWAVYFVPEVIHEKIDAIYSSMHFERFFLPDNYQGTPAGATTMLNEKIESCRTERDNIDKKLKELLSSYRQSFIVSYAKLRQYTANFDIRKLAAVTKNAQRPFYILCGWMTEKDAKRFYKQIEKDPQAFCIIEENHNNLSSKPPIKLRNSILTKPFEMFVDMYGLPDYNEFDPTLIIAVLYSLIFGFMFGDVGQGLILVIAGFLLAHYKKSRLAAIVARCGIFSVIFGFLFGSFFGFEDIIPALWLHPAKAISSLPVIGNLNTVFVVTVALGMLIILFTMILNIFNRMRFKEPGEALFDTNGVAGFVFYLSVIVSVFLVMTGRTLPAAAVVIVMFVLPLLVIFFKEPLTHLIEKKAHLFPEDRAMFIVQGLFEMVEVLLSYFSNTLSFVRIGAFAVSHAAMMEVVLMLGGAESGNINWLVVILGNIFVMGMEGLIVGIQVLRLQYYELFSRFYRGGGRAFIPYGKNI